MNPKRWVGGLTVPKMGATVVTYRGTENGAVEAHRPSPEADVLEEY